MSTSVLRFNVNKATDESRISFGSVPAADRRDSKSMSPTTASAYDKEIGGTTDLMNGNSDVNGHQASLCPKSELASGTRTRYWWVRRNLKAIRVMRPWWARWVDVVFPFTG